MKTIHKYLGPKSECSTYEAEWVGAILAIWLILTVARDTIGHAPISLYIDNQSVIKSLKNRKPAPGQRLKDAFLDLSDELRPASNGHPAFKMIWISAHSEVERNEAIDEEAKSAAHGQESTYMQLPPPIRLRLPHSKSAIVQKLKDEAKAEWAKQWNKSPRHGIWRAIDSELTCKTFRAITAKMPRYHASLLVQLRTKHIPLNDYLYKRNLTDSYLCSQCHRGRRETIDHFMYECPAFREQREKMDTALGPRKRDLKASMKNKADLKAIATYMASTGRLPKVKRWQPPQEATQPEANGEEEEEGNETETENDGNTTREGEEENER
ncbi:hypothetical protein D9611_009893 [Ephemerocybe angulata]|uniref:RNase H type-1 domain-containing protein n=1 Tax=Ephemerocybe angulata TaxID=980116 RepID=A0A8H5FJC2_9AGAR|nr:hypothetical protein D9611_009893 [Tulosesus angulatus]